MLRHIRFILIISGTLFSLFALHKLEVFYRGEMLEWLDGAGQYRHIISYTLGGFMSFLAGSIPFVLVEMTSSTSSRREHLYTRYMFPLVIWFCYYFLTNFVVLITVLIKKYLVISSFNIPVEIPQLGHILLYIVLIDFFGYWFHRLEHKVSFLWKFHSTHHSLQNLNALNQYGHWFEGMFRFFAVYLPVLIFIPTPDLSASSIAVIWGTWTLYVHTSSPDLSLPPWARYVFVDNLFHHYHHGYEKKYYNKNFAGLFSIWDMLFGTYLKPNNKKFPKTGLRNLEPPSNISEYLIHPFKYEKKE